MASINSIVREKPSAALLCIQIFLGLYVLFAGLSIALSQLAVVAAIGSWLYWERERGLKLRSDLSPSLVYFLKSLAAFMLLALVSALIGLAPERSLPEVLKTAVYVLLPFCIYRSLFQEMDSPSHLQARVDSLLCVLVLSQALAAGHTVLSGVFASEIWPKVPGAVTESGQLLLVCAAAIALYFGWRRSEERSFFGIDAKLLLYAIFFVFVLSVCRWKNGFFAEGTLSSYLGSFLFCCSILAGLLLIYRSVSEHFVLDKKHFSRLIRFFLCLMLLALMINLKRGPWLGLAVCVSLIGFFYSKRMLLGLFGFILLSFLLFAPARERALAFAQDFSIQGGRKSMWYLGTEMTALYPLGVGFENAEHIRTLDPSLPDTHRHMHNNLLNITVETGWIGLIAYLWWMYISIKTGLSAWKESRAGNRELHKAGFTALCLSCGLFGWQVAGLVEYNFGDGEVRMIAFLYMGLILALSDMIRRNTIRKTSQN